MCDHLKILSLAVLMVTNIAHLLAARQIARHSEVDYSFR
jgi:hypothetical protein